MIEHLSRVQDYWTPTPDSFWEWRDGGDVVTWRDGGTIAFRAEVLEVLRRLQPHGFPHFDAIVLFLAACRAPEKIGEAEIETYGVLPPLTDSEKTNWRYRDLLVALANVSAVAPSIRGALPGKVEMAAMLFETGYLFASNEVTAAILMLMERGLADEVNSVRRKPEDLDDLSRLAPLAAGANRIAPDQLALRQKTGLEQLPEPAPVAAPPAEPLRALLGRLENDGELGGLARLARNLMAALTLPRAMSEAEDLPLGGVSDITNRGPLDRLLVSELAHDDLTFTVRVALSEALFLRREAPPHVPPQRRLVMIDCGLRMWGLPRVFGTAAALALSVSRHRQSETVVYRARGAHLDLADLGTREGLVAHLAALEPEAHPGAALPVFRRIALAEAGSGEGPGEAVLITGHDVLADKTFQRRLGEIDLPVLYVVAVGRNGELRLTRHGTRGTKVLREVHCRLEEILAPRPHVTPLVNRGCDPSLPAILRLAAFPLRLPHHIDPARLLGDGQFGALCVTSDGRLTHWDRRCWGARQLSDTIPRGIRHWHACRRSAQSVMSVVVGRLPQRDLHLLHVALDTGTCRSTRLALQQLNPRGVAAHAGALFVIFADRMEVFSAEDGQPIESRSLPKGTRWLRDRFFRAPDGWYALSFNGSAAQFEMLCNSQLIREQQLLAPFDIAGRDGPAYITASGRIQLIVDSSSSDRGSILHTEPLFANVVLNQPSESAAIADPPPPLRIPRGLPGGPFHIGGISADGCRIVLIPPSTPQKQRASFLIDLRKGEARRTFQDPATALAGNLLDAISGRNLRHKFVAIAVREGRLTLVGSGKRSPMRIEFDSRTRSIRLEPSAARAEGKRVPFVATPGPLGIGYRLWVAEWADGSRAYLDSRGLLHLKSSHAGIPELTLVLSDGVLGGWCANGGVFGPAYFTGTTTRENGEIQESIFDSVLREFVMRLP